MKELSRIALHPEKRLRYEVQQIIPDDIRFVSCHGDVALCGLMGLIIPADGLSERLRDFSLVLLYPAVFLLTSGTFLGAVWANVSWGSYWSWDPKETWALITLLIYAVALHGGCLKAFRNPRFFHAYSIIGFLSVLVTYFGVNLLLGGMHAYA